MQNATLPSTWVPTFYFIGYMSSISVIRSLFYSTPVRSTESFLAKEFANSGIENFNFDLIRNQLGDFFCAAFVAQSGEYLIDQMCEKYNWQLGQTPRKLISSVATFAALVLYEHQQSKRSDYGFDTKDTIAYGLGLAMFLCLEPAVHAWRDWKKEKSLENNRGPTV